MRNCLVKKYEINKIEIEFDPEGPATFSSQEMAAASRLLALHRECEGNHDLFVKALEAKDSDMIVFLIKQGIDRFILQLNKFSDELEGAMENEE